MHPAVSNGAYDVNRIRADFPILAMQVYGKPLVYLDNAASAQKPRAVLDRLEEAYTAQYANVHRGLHFLANEATEAYENAREKVAGFLNARFVGTLGMSVIVNDVARHVVAREGRAAGRVDVAFDRSFAEAFGIAFALAFVFMGGLPARCAGAVGLRRPPLAR